MEVSIAAVVVAFVALSEFCLLGSVLAKLVQLNEMAIIEIIDATLFKRDFLMVIPGFDICEIQKKYRNNITGMWSILVY